MNNNSTNSKEVIYDDSDSSGENLSKAAAENMMKILEQERYEASLPKHKRGRTKPLKRHKKRNKK